MSLDELRLVEDARAALDEATHAQEKANDRQSVAAKALREAKLSLREIASLLGISHTVVARVLER